MATDYVLFIHGVNTRRDDTQPTYAEKLFELIKEGAKSSTRSIEPIVIYWGDATDVLEENLLKNYQASPIWDKLWFKPIRENQTIRFTGDIALYLSRYVGARVADLVAKSMSPLKNCSSDDRLHLVTHSLGTVILFDLLFSARWDQKDMLGHDSVMAIRDAIYGVTGESRDPKQGMRIGSISTMGSPIGIFSLMDVNQLAEDAKNANGDVICTHDITPRMEQLLDYLHQELNGNKLSWRNFVHPGDPIGCTLEGLIPKMVDGRNKYIDIHDILVPATMGEILAQPLLEALADLLTEPVSQTIFALLQAGNAHLSYLQSGQVAEVIAQMIQQSRVS